MSNDERTAHDAAKAGPLRSELGVTGAVAGECIDWRRLRARLLPPADDEIGMALARLVTRNGPASAGLPDHEA